MTRHHPTRGARALSALLAPIVLIAGLLTASPAAAADTDVCTGPDRYLLLVDPTGIANQALCRTQERVLAELSEQQWGVEYTSEQRHRILRWGRNEALAAIYVEVLRIAQERPADRTADEALVYTWLQQTLGALRVRLANGAYAEYLEWTHDPCGYVPPTPGATAVGCADPGSLVTLFGQPPGPSYEEFVSYGAQRVLGTELPGSQLAIASAAARSVTNQYIGAAVGGVAAFPLAGSLVAAVMLGASAQGLFASTAALTGVGTAAAVASGTSALALTIGVATATILFVVIAVVIAVVRGIQVVEQAEIPNQLLDDISTGDDPVDVASWIGDDGNRATLLLYALSSRINTATPPAVSIPTSPASDAPGFLVRSGVDDTDYTQSIRFRSPLDDDAFYTAWLDNGWWIVGDDAGGLGMTHDLVYLDHDRTTRSASPDGDGFVVTTPSTATTSAACSAANGCEQTAALRILTPPTGDTDPLTSTATLLTSPIAFTHLPDDIQSDYAVGDTVGGFVTAQASYLTTMSYRWQLSHAGQTATVDGGTINRTLTTPGDYRMTAIATAASGESARHEWTFTVAGDATGEYFSGILVTQYPADSADGTPPGEPGPWVEGSTSGTICVSTEGADPTDFAVQFVGDDAMTATAVTAGYACFPRPASATEPGVHVLARVSACPTTPDPYSLCVPPMTLDWPSGALHSAFSYTVANALPTVGAVSVGRTGGSLEETDPSHPTHFDRGDTLEARAIVSDPGGAPLTVHVRWSDGTGQTLTDVPSGSEVVLTHAYTRSAWGPSGVQLQAVDSAGADSNLETGFFVVLPLTPALEVTASARADGLVTLGGSYLDEDGTASHLGIDWGDGTTETFTNPFPLPLDTGDTSADELAGRFAVAHHYASGGTHGIQVILYNGAPQWGADAVDVTIPGTAPVLRADGPIEVSDDGAIGLDALLGDLGPGDVLALHADFGDGETADYPARASGDTVRVVHDYAPGQHEVTLTATDASGLESDAVVRCVVTGHMASEPCPGVLPADDTALHGTSRGEVDGPPRAHAGDTVEIHAGSGTAGHEVRGYLYSTPVGIGFFHAAAAGTGSLTIPASTAPGPHSIALVDGGVLLGWFPIDVEAADPAGSGGGAAGVGGPTAAGLAGTGAQLGAPLLGVALLLLLGTALTAASRRRRAQFSKR